MEESWAVVVVSDIDSVAVREYAVVVSLAARVVVVVSGSSSEDVTVDVSVVPSMVGLWAVVVVGSSLVVAVEGS